MRLLIVFVCLYLYAAAVFAQQELVVEAIQDFMDFATYSEGAITPQQIASVGASEFFFVDTRSAEQYEAGHIAGAVNIEWRQLLSRREQLPEGKSIVLYCDTGLLSSKAHLALRLVGFDENLKVMFGGYNNWKAQQGVKDD